MILGALCLSLSGWAQNEIDALRYSQLDVLGTARFVSMGGAFGALGADLSTLSYNPAGIAMYRRSEFGISLGVKMDNFTTQYSGSTLSYTDAYTGINSIGMVGSYPTASKEVPRLNFGVAYNKLANFNETFTIQGNVEGTTLLDVFVQQAQGVTEDELTDAFPFSAGLAYQTYLINPTDTLGSGNYDNVLPYGEITQSKTVERSGSMGETVLSGGGNINDKVYVGVTMGFPNIRFQEDGLYREVNHEPGLDLDNYSFRESLTVSGSGFNLKAGAIVRVTDWIRLGGAVHTPTWLSLTEFYERSITSNFKGEDPYVWESPAGEYSYRIKTPARYMANAAVIAGKMGVVSVDYEFVNYGAARLRTSNRIFDDYDFAAENEVIREIYRPTHNVSIGAEMRVLKSLRLRAGAAYRQNPFVDDVVSNNDDLIIISGGVGFRKQNFYAEVGYAQTTTAEDYYLYDPNRVEVATASNNTGQGVLTIGFRY